MIWYEKIIAAHRRVTDSVSHIQRIKSNRYFVWEEDYIEGLEADNALNNSRMFGVTDLFTQIEFDPWVEDLGEAFTAEGILWGYEFIEREEETGLYHHQWDWSVEYGKN